MNRRSARAVVALAVAVTSVLAVTGTAPAGAAGGGEGDPRAWQHWRTDLHAHSVVSGDATVDPGVIASYAKNAGFNAVYLTDHQAASYNLIGGVIASHVSFDDDAGANRQWNDVPSNPTATLSAGLSTEHALSGTNGYRVSASGAGEAFGWIKRGPNLRSGQITLRFSVYPTRIDAASGLYVSMSLGGDGTVPSRESDGYTTSAGTVLPGRSTTLVWQLGNARTASDDGVTRVITRPLDYTLNQWNTYSLDVTQAVLDAFPDPSTRPSELNALLFMKMAAASTGGTATGWFDSYNLDAANAPTKSAGSAAAAANDFIARNQVIGTWDTPTFRLLPGMEMGGNDHAQRLHYPISDPSQWEQFSKGVDGIAPTQASGYPAQLNHPGFPGGVTDEEALTNAAYGAEAMETVERGTNDVMIRDFDALLHSGEPLVGTWTSDSHRNATFAPATFLQSPALTDGELLHSLFEGRAFLARVDFPGSVSFAPDDRGGSYPARYPLYRSASDGLSTLRLQVTAGIPDGSTVVWLRDGQVVRSDVVSSGGSYDGALVLAVPSTSTPVRAEVRRPDGSRLLMTEPVMLRSDAELPRGMTVHVERVVTTSGAGYVKSSVRGLTALSFDTTANELTTTLSNPAGSRVLQVIRTGSRGVSRVQRDGSTLAQASSSAALLGSSDEGWFFDAGRHELLLQTTQPGAQARVAIQLVPGSDTTPPSIPAPIDALALDARHVRLSWGPSDDDTGVTRYVVRRNGVVVAAAGPSTTSYADTNVTPDTAYTYSVQAEDGSSNLSPEASAAVRTQPVVLTPRSPLADTYVSSAAPSSNYGTAKTMKADGSPEVNSYLRFPPPPVDQLLLSASLRLTSTANLPSGVRVHSLDDRTWSETGLTWSNAPPPGPQVGTSSAVTGGTAFTTDVTGAVSSDTPTVNLVVRNLSASNISMYTKENGTSVPALVYETSTVAPYARDVAVTTPEDVPVTFTPQVGGGNGTALSCRISSVPTSGSVWIAPDCSSGQFAPGRDFNGVDRFAYEVSDGTQRVQGQGTMTMTPVNDPPTTDAEILGASTDEDTPVDVVLQGTDVDGDCPLTITIISSPSHGRLGPITGLTCTNGSVSATTRYTPDLDFNGNDAFSFTLTDPSGATSAPAGLAITVAPVDDPPTASDVAIDAAPGMATPWNPVVQDVDSPDLTCSVSAAPSKGTMTVTSNCSGGSYTAGSGSSGSDTGLYAVSDGSATRTARLMITIGGPPTVFFDGFESGSTSAWTKAVGVTVPLAEGRTGLYAAFVDSRSGGPSYLRVSPPGSPTTTQTSAGIKVTANPTSGITSLIRLRASDDTALVTLSYDTGRRLRLRNEITKTLVNSAVSLPLGAWTVVELRVTASGSNASIQVLIDGVVAPGLNTSPDLGAYRVATVQFGDNARGPTGAFLLDDVRIAAS